MITLHLEAENPGLLIDDVKRMFNLVERDSAPVITTDDLRAALKTDDEVRATATEAAATEPAPKKNSRKKGETAEIKAAIVGKPDETPAAAPTFLSEEKAAEAAPEVSLDTMREVAHKLAGTEGKGMPAVADILKTFKAEDGSVVAKMSQVQPADRGKAVAAFEAAMKG